MKTKLFFIILITQLLNCQKMDKEDLAFHVQISQPDDRYEITPVFDKIFTLEGWDATLPYGSSSGKWGNSGKGWTEQYGTPIGADITYYSRYEDLYYHLKADFPKEKIEDYMERAYSIWDDPKGETQEYKKLGRGLRNSIRVNSYNSFSTLVFGFAPKGMVVVWLNFGNTRIELDRYQATVITDKQEIATAKEKYQRTYRIDPQRYEEAKIELAVPDASPLQWDNYRIRYNWRPIVSSENKKFKLLAITNDAYNAEKEGALRPWVLNIPYRERAVPREMVFIWETEKDKHEQLLARVFFNWDKTNAAFKKAGTKIDMQIKIAEDNSSLEIFLNNEPFKVDSVRIFQWKGNYKE